MNPALASIAAEAAGPSAMEYITTVGAFIVVLYLINKVGDVKMILYVLVVVGAFILAVYGIPGMENTAIYPLVVEFVQSLPGLLDDVLGKIGGII